MRGLVYVLCLAGNLVSLSALQQFTSVLTPRRCISMSFSSSSSSSEKKSITLGLGCFWEPSEKLAKVDGVLNTRVGYTGGESESPTYQSVCRGDGNVEVVKVIYDNNIVSYEDVLDAAFSVAKPSSKRQYLPIVFTADEREERRAQQWCAQDKEREDGLRSNQFTVERASTFYLAEEYHQNYWQKQRPRLAFLAIAYLGQTFGPANSILSSPAISRALTIVTLGLACVIAFERLLNTQVREEPLASIPDSPSSRALW